MKTPNVKAIALSLIFCFQAIHSLANPFFFPEDTSRKILMSSVIRLKDSIVVIKEANVEFPAILTGNEAKVIDYVEKFSTSRKGYLVRTYNRSRKLFPKAAEILKKYNVPQEFKVLLALESGFNPNAVSSAGAVGYWQFMDEVAREYGLKIVSAVKRDKKGKTGNRHKQTNKVDERKNFAKSTHAAARYLKDRGRNLNNDWLLIAASYNWGVGNVWNAMEKTGKANPDFWDIRHYLPAETKSYVMNFIALNVIFNNYEKFTKNELLFKPVTARKMVPSETDILPVDIASML